MQRTADAIKEALEQAIITGEFGDGDRLDEVRLSERFKVSRTPIREALQMLSSSGLVELRPRRGAFVRYPSFIELVEMFEVMGELEGLSGRLAARRIDKWQLADLEDACARCEEASEAGDTDIYYRENERFHRLFYEASGNSFLCSEASKLHKRLQPFRRLQLRVRGRMKQSMREHRAILEAIRAGNAVEAEKVARDHVTVQGEKFNDLMAGYQSDQNRVRQAG